MPNAFSPNGDGIHDTWELPFLKKFEHPTVQVFNRYGQIVYNSNGYYQPWDGTCKNTKLPVATYYYIIKRDDRLPLLSGAVSIFW